MATIVQFESRIGNLIMFKQHAVQLLKLMGLSGEIPSAIKPIDIQNAVNMARSHPALASNLSQHSDKSDTETNISLRVRATPLLDLMDRAQIRNCEVIWR
ncbi:MAG: DUF1840 family protein [Burkholderiales bacterium]|nr:DUF1840 family protein [Burkholderiales bacterium]MDG2202047.1 DUF1840 family protein [Burkholderiales bacterium]